MKEVALKQLIVGAKAMMKAGSPVRMWMRRNRDGSRWFTPVNYIPQSDDARNPGSEPQYMKVKIAKVMFPYVVVRRHNGRGWVKLWIDTREVPLYSPWR